MREILDVERFSGYCEASRRRGGLKKGGNQHSQLNATPHPLSVVFQAVTFIIILLHASCTSNIFTHTLLDWLGICSKVECKPAICCSVIIL